MALKVKETSTGFLTQLIYEEQRISEKPLMNTGGGVGGGVSGGASGGVNGLLKLIKTTPGIKTVVLMQKLSVSKRTIERWIKKLRKADLTEFRGAPKTGGYYAIDKKEQ